MARPAWGWHHAMEKGFRFSLVDAGKPLRGLMDGSAGLDRALCADWAGGQERGSETPSVGGCRTWVGCAEACETEVQWGQERGCAGRPCWSRKSPLLTQCLPPSGWALLSSGVYTQHPARAFPGKVTGPSCGHFLWSP